MFCTACQKTLSRASSAKLARPTNLGSLEPVHWKKAWYIAESGG